MLTITSTNLLYEINAIISKKSLVILLTNTSASTVSKIVSILLPYKDLILISLIYKKPFIK